MLTGDDPVHEPWVEGSQETLSPEAGFWKNYRSLVESRLPPTALVELDRSTDRIVDLLGDPRREGTWDRRGLVIGHVQSGKTNKYLGAVAAFTNRGSPAPSDQRQVIRASDCGAVTPRNTPKAAGPRGSLRTRQDAMERDRGPSRWADTNSTSGSLRCGGLLAGADRSGACRRPALGDQGRGCQLAPKASVRPSTSVATGAAGSVTSTTVRVPSGQAARIERPSVDHPFA